MASSVAGSLQQAAWLPEGLLSGVMLASATSRGGRREFATAVQRLVRSGAQEGCKMPAGVVVGGHVADKVGERGKEWER